LSANDAFVVPVDAFEFFDASLFNGFVGASKEAFATFARQRAKVNSCSFAVANLAR
jgi:hypothetical protein